MSEDSADKAHLAYKFFIWGALFLFCALYTAFTIYTPLSRLSAFILAINCVSFYLCGYDKSAARGRSIRVPERVFYALAGLGGAPLLLVGMRLLRHKTRKAGFQLMLALIIVLQIVLLRYLNETYGPLFIRV